MASFKPYICSECGDDTNNIDGLCDQCCAHPDDDDPDYMLLSKDEEYN